MTRVDGLEGMGGLEGWGLRWDRGGGRGGGIGGKVRGLIFTVIPLVFVDFSLLPN